MSAAFRIHVTGRGRDDTDIRRSIGKHARFKLQSNRGSRVWHAVVSNISQTDHGHGHATYSIWLAPKLWLLTHRVHHRIHQHESIPQIANDILRPLHIEPMMHLKEEHPKLEYRVQYGESDYDFLRRLLIEAGISFYFEF